MANPRTLSGPLKMVKQYTHNISALTMYVCTGQLYCLQARPIVTLPCSFFFRPDARGSKAVLWDNSNIVESYSGVTTPLTFSFASRAYEQVPICVCA